jgi:hypothetical protein
VVVTGAAGQSLPFIFAAQQPTAVAIDDDIYLRVQAALLESPSEVEAIDIVTPAGYVGKVIKKLWSAA